jgi:hypothetical protein
LKGWGDVRNGLGSGKVTRDDKQFSVACLFQRRELHLVPVIQLSASSIRSF